MRGTYTRHKIIIQYKVIIKFKIII
jgi:hypothetical protein